eukprot:CAMPEP_0177657682 /NCGR_PEP_ID=MMETSP0447-20121125/16337_1 /TAXON_ID=0 /ORGANISM="Stygamoeba regulata, Strain BSH-02190019" /LENGTH=482 /DNA_ID=CAMNT_0019162097 /DNA_START=80 /DNA_END=1528 /DNA_ORIENTATION=+
MAASVRTSSSLAKDFLSFVNASPSPFHAVDECVKRLKDAGFKKLSEKEDWSSQLQPGLKYYFTRNYSSVVAFVVGGAYKPGSGFNVIGAHTDSPCLKLKPISALSKAGFLQVGVQTYGGGQWCTWFDRDLKLAGRVLTRDDSTEEAQLAHRLVHIDRPLLRVPTLAIHLNRTLNTDGFKINEQTQLAPVLATQVKAQLDAAPAAATSESASSSSSPHHHPLLLRLLAEEMKCDPQQIEDFELCLADHQPAAIGGALDEFLFAPRLDNLLSSYCSLRALLEYASDAEAVARETNVQTVACFDHEEVGSKSFQGADSTLIDHFISRVIESLAPADMKLKNIREMTYSNSFLLSADMAHALHPNYTEKHDEKHGPAIHAGVVLKHNANQRYATSAVSAFLIRQVGKMADVPLQEFVVRQDMGCGSTIGPMLSARGLRTVDVGAPQLSMHSIREMCGVDDVDHYYNLFRSFFRNFTALDARLEVDA